MQMVRHWTPTTVPLACILLAFAPTLAAAQMDPAAVKATIRNDVAKIIAGLNAHDPARATAFDASNIVGMECDHPPILGMVADSAGFQDMFAHVPDWKARLISETVDVSAGGDLAVYRGTYHEDGRSNGVMKTHRTNFLAEFRRASDGSFTMVWYMVGTMEPSHAM